MNVETTNQSHDTQHHPSLLHPPLLDSLPSSALPNPDSPSGPRLLIIGDVHGQLSALDALLSKAGFSSERGDHVVFTGDMVNKGPDSPGVVDRAIAIGAYGVRGNHEDRVLRAWDRELKRRERKDKKKGKHHSKGIDEEEEEEETEDQEEEGVEGEELEAQRKRRKSEKADLATALSLSPQHIDWLASLPVILRVGRVSPRFGDVVVVHAGLVPGVPLEKQDPRVVMTMRTLISSRSLVSSDINSTTPTTSESSSEPKMLLMPSEGREGRPWSKVWNELQKDKTRKNKKGKGKGKNEKEKGKDGKKKKGDPTPTTVVYGHDAKTGLSVRRYAIGLDSSCVRGGDLTAVVFEPAGASALHEEHDNDNDSESEDNSADPNRETLLELRGATKHGIKHRLVSVSCKAGIDSVDDSQKDREGKGKGKEDKQSKKEDKKEKHNHKQKGKGNEGKKENKVEETWEDL